MNSAFHCAATSIIKIFATISYRLNRISSAFYALCENLGINQEVSSAIGLRNWVVDSLQVSLDPLQRVFMIIMFLSKYLLNQLLDESLLIKLTVMLNTGSAFWKNRIFTY
jgi:hypothetical protein